MNHSYRRITINRCDGYNLFDGTEAEFEKDDLYKDLWPETLAAFCERNGWTLEYLIGSFNLELEVVHDAHLVKNALASASKIVRAELELLKISKERPLTLSEQAMLPHTLRGFTQKQLQEQINPWDTLVTEYEELLKKVCDGIDRWWYTD